MDELANWTPRTISSDKAAAFRACLFNRIQPPASFKLAEWAEANIVLPAGQSARHARDYATDEIEPLFQSSPSLSGLMIQGRIAGRKYADAQTVRSAAGCC